MDRSRVLKLRLVALLCLAAWVAGAQPAPAEPWDAAANTEAEDAPPQVAPRRAPKRGAGGALPVAFMEQAENFESLDREGRALLRDRKFEEAHQVYARALSLARNERQAAQAWARGGQALGGLGREREAIESFQKSLELFHYGQVEDDLKEMRQKLWSRTQSVEEIGRALSDQRASHRGTRILPARPLPLKVLFEFDSASLTAQGSEQVRQLADALKAGMEGGEAIQITGHTDLIGSDEYNQALSERRAQTVAMELTRHYGVPAERVRVQGHGMREPLYPTTDTQESELNRRVEVMLLAGAPSSVR